MQIVPYIYQLFLEAVDVAVSRTMCSFLALVCLVPLAHGVQLGVAPDPPRNQRLPCVFFVVGPLRGNLKIQYSISRIDNAMATWEQYRITLTVTYRQAILLRQIWLLLDIFRLRGGLALLSQEGVCGCLLLVVKLLWCQPHTRPKQSPIRAYLLLREHTIMPLQSCITKL